MNSTHLTLWNNDFANHPSFAIHLRTAIGIHKSSTFEYREYQPRFAALYSTRPINICAGAQGLGKTVITALTVLTLYNVKTLRPGAIQIVVPNQLVSNRWVTDFTRFSQLLGRIEFISSEAKAVKSTCPIWIITMDFYKRKSKVAKSIAHRLIKEKKHPIFLIVDEVHHFKGNSDRFRILKKIRKRVSRLLLLSGTLSDGNIEQIYDLLKFAYPKNFHWIKSQFLREFQTKKASATNYLTGEEDLVDQPTRYLPALSVYKIPTYSGIVESKIHRVRLDDPSVKCCITLPTPEISEYKLELAPDHQAYYQHLVQTHRSELERLKGYADTVVGRAKALQMLEPLIRAVSYPDDFTPTKLIKCGDLVEAFKDQGKTVIFTDKIGSGRRVHNYLSERFGSQHCVRIYADDPEIGRMSPAKREETLSQFLWKDDIFAGTFSIRLAGEGIDLLQASSIIFYDLPWEAIKVAQAISRCVRPGAVKPFVKIAYLFQRTTIDEHMFRLNQAKQAQMSLLLDYSNSDIGQSSHRINVSDVLDLVLQG